MICVTAALNMDIRPGRSECRVRAAPLSLRAAQKLVKTE